jgi:hypothetical protein
MELVEDKKYLVATVMAEYGRTHNHIANMYSKETLLTTDYKKIPTRVGQTVTIFDTVEGVLWVTYITKVK